MRCIGPAARNWAATIYGWRIARSRYRGRHRCLAHSREGYWDSSRVGRERRRSGPPKGGSKFITVRPVRIATAWERCCLT